MDHFCAAIQGLIFPSSQVKRQRALIEYGRVRIQKFVGGTPLPLK
jgi:hypothetical protein